MLILSGGLVLSSAVNLRNPIFGWRNLVTPGNISISPPTLIPLSDPANPVTNLANPATNLYWRAVDARARILLHFDGPQGSTSISDDVNLNSWSVFGGAIISSSTYKFGGSSLQLNGTDAYIRMPDTGRVTLGSSDFTFECWFRCTKASGSLAFIIGQIDAAIDPNTLSFEIGRHTTNVMRARVAIGPTEYFIFGTTAFGAGMDQNWHHIAFVRTGNILKLFIDGFQEGGDVAIAGSINDSTQHVYIGERSGGSAFWQGQIDELRLSVGVARYTSNFTPPSAPFSIFGPLVEDVFINIDIDQVGPIDYVGIASHNFGTAQIAVTVERIDLTQSPPAWVELIETFIPANDSPIIMRFEPQSIDQLRIRLQPGNRAPQAAVIYVGKLLVMERGLPVDAGHSPINFGRTANIVNGRSTSANFLGRIVLGEETGGAAPFLHLTNGFYRAEVDPFIRASVETPFFFAWKPQEYPGDVGYAWMTNDPIPTFDLTTGRVGISFEFAGVV